MWMRGNEIGRAGRLLSDDLRRLAASCSHAYRAAEALGGRAAEAGITTGMSGTAGVQVRAGRS